VWELECKKRSSLCINEHDILLLIEKGNNRQCASTIPTIIARPECRSKDEIVKENKSNELETWTGNVATVNHPCNMWFSILEEQLEDQGEVGANVHLLC